MTARIIDGSAIAAAVRAEVAAGVSAHLAAGGAQPHLTVILVGDDPASATYVRGKATACAEVGISTDTVLLPAGTSQRELLQLITRLNVDRQVSGILVQTPIPGAIDEPAIMAALNPDKDVDGLHPSSLGRLVQGEPSMLPCTPAGVQQMLLRSGYDPAGARVVIVGRSMLVGRPLGLLLGLKRPGGNATVTMAHTATRDLASVTREAEILVVAAGRPKTITADMVRPGAAVIDVGTNRIDAPERKSGWRLVGDVDFVPVSEIAGAVSPVPGGVGPMTIAMLLSNTLKAAQGTH